MAAHQWHLHTQYCERCGQSPEDVADGRVPECAGGLIAISHLVRGGPLRDLAPNPDR
jgi:hypothetical protein